MTSGQIYPRLENAYQRKKTIYEQILRIVDEENRIMNLSQNFTSMQQLFKHERALLTKIDSIDADIEQIIEQFEPGPVKHPESLDVLLDEIGALVAEISEKQAEVGTKMENSGNIECD